LNVLLAIWRQLGRWPALQRFLLRRLNPTFLVGVVAVVFDAQGRVLLFHHTYRRQWDWSLPGGWLRRGEEPADAVAREIKEETSLEVEVLGPLAATALPVAPNFEVIFRGRLRGGVFRPSAEVDRIEWFDLDDLPDIKPYQEALIRRAAGHVR